MNVCPICGERDQLCAGTAPVVLPVSGLIEGGPMAKMKIRLPKQHTRIGVAGYLGGARIETYDPRSPVVAPPTVVSGPVPKETSKSAPTSKSKSAGGASS